MLSFVLGVLVGVLGTLYKDELKALALKIKEKVDYPKKD